MQNLKKEILKLTNKIVTFKRIAGNTIILYFDGEPGGINTKSIWIDPSWYYERDNRYIVGSQDFPWKQEDGQSDEEYNKNFEEICNLTNNLIGAKIIKVEIEKSSNSICLFLNNKQVVRNMAVSKDDEVWIYRDHSKKNTILAFVDRLENEKGVT